MQPALSPEPRLDSGMMPFAETTPTRDNYWRSVILFGQNVASYKFALGQSLLELADRDRDQVPLEDLAVPFARHLCEHLKAVDKQSTSAQSRFLQARRAFNRGELSETHLIEQTVRLGFINVIDAFHVVNRGEIPIRFFVDERRGSTRGIRLTDELRQVHQDFQYRNLPFEVEARWRLVETAWELNLPRHALAVTYEPDGELLVVPGGNVRRRPITGARDALNGYQKGICFYCWRPIDVLRADVDHFLPHTLATSQIVPNIDGVWNLVLACKDCNRGPRGKFAQVPEGPYLELLHKRNEYLIGSHHPLRETLILQTGAAEADRSAFLREAWKEAVNLLIHLWRPEIAGAPAL
jgi:5-methylcytosine-specific restriction endonuclease McrA